MQNNTKLTVMLLAAGVLAAPLVAGLVGNGGTSNAANKTTATASDVELLGSPVTNGAFSVAETILSTRIKTSAPTDLLLQLTMECALWTEVTTVGNGVQESTAAVKAWVEVDGVPVQSGLDGGKVVFCDRTQQQETSLFDDENATLRSFLRTRSASAFNWIDLDVGSGIHTIVVKAELAGEATDRASSQAAVGLRTLIVEPTKFARGATL